MNPYETTTTYLRSKVMSASPEELRLMLLDGALKFAHLAASGLERNDFEASYSGFTQCRAIVLELGSSINIEQSPEVGTRVRALYNFLYTELVDASHERDLPRLNKVIELLEYERETWSLLMQQLEVERAGQPANNQPRQISYQA